MSFDLINTIFDDAKIIKSFFSVDDRGSFLKIFHNNNLVNNGINFNIKEIFISTSKKNVIRGLHFQYKNSQSKMVTIIKGSCYDVIVDLRRNSNTYLNYQMFLLDAINHDILYIPKGFAHGFLTLEDDTHMLYFCDNVYDSSSDTGIMYNDSRLSIAWPCEDYNKIIISERDKNLMTVDEFEKKKLFVYD